MDRSLGFGSAARDYTPCSDSVSLRLRHSCALTSPRTATALTACRSTVSGSLSLPSRGSFHLSLTVLCAIGSRHVLSLGGWSPLLPAGFLVSRRTQDRVPCGLITFAYGAFTLSDGPSQTLRLALRFLTARASPEHVLQPHECVHPWFGLFPFRSPLLGESLLISFPAGT